MLTFLKFHQFIVVLRFFRLHSTDLVQILPPLFHNRTYSFFNGAIFVRVPLGPAFVGRVSNLNTRPLFSNTSCIMQLDLFCSSYMDIFSWQIDDTQYSCRAKELPVKRNYFLAQDKLVLLANLSSQSWCDMEKMLWNTKMYEIKLNQTKRYLITVWSSISSKLLSLKKVQFIGTPIVGPVLVSYYYRGKQEYMEEICCIW
jgi:hypothetical protein